MYWRITVGMLLITSSASPRVTYSTAFIMSFPHLPRGPRYQSPSFTSPASNLFVAGAQIQKRSHLIPLLTRPTSLNHFRISSARHTGPRAKTATGRGNILYLRLRQLQTAAVETPAHSATSETPKYSS